MTYYLRERNGLPSACVALEKLEVAVVYAIAAWNSKLDKDGFQRGHSREIAVGRVQKALNGPINVMGELYSTDKTKYDDEGNVVEKHPARQVGAIIPPVGEKEFRHVLEHIAATGAYPQRARNGAKRELAFLEWRDKHPEMKDRKSAVVREMYERERRAL